MPPRNWNRRELIPPASREDSEELLALLDGELAAAKRSFDPMSREVRQAQAARDSVARKVEAFKTEDEERERVDEDAKKLNPAEFVDKHLPRGF